MNKFNEIIDELYELLENEYELGNIENIMNMRIDINDFQTEIESRINVMKYAKNMNKN